MSTAVTSSSSTNFHTQYNLSVFTVNKGWSGVGTGSTEIAGGHLLRMPEVDGPRVTTDGPTG